MTAIVQIYYDGKYRTEEVPCNSGEPNESIINKVKKALAGSNFSEIRVLSRNP
jgi:hypothetical protein